MWSGSVCRVSLTVASRAVLRHAEAGTVNVLMVWFRRACACWWTPGTSWASAGRAVRTRSRACWWCRGKDGSACRGWSPASSSCTWWRWARCGPTPASKRPTPDAPSSSWWVDRPHNTQSPPFHVFRRLLKSSFITSPESVRTVHQTDRRPLHHCIKYLWRLTGISGGFKARKVLSRFHNKVLWILCEFDEDNMNGWNTAPRMLFSSSISAHYPRMLI